MTNNRFDALDSEIETCKPNLNEKHKSKKSSNGQRANRNVKKWRKRKHKLTTAKVSVTQHPRLLDSFSSIHIESDSHGRHLAGLLQSLVPRATRVSGVCKPGAKLLDVLSGSPPPPGSCCIIMAGTNDVADGVERNIFRHLERRLVDRLRTSRKVIVCTLPYRHDLPENHPVHLKVELVNSFIDELCKRYAGLEKFNFNVIRRGNFTRHGMHLSMKGKRLLAKLLSKVFVRLGSASQTCSSPSQPSALLPTQPSNHSSTPQTQPSTPPTQQLPSTPPTQPSTPPTQPVPSTPPTQPSDHSSRPQTQPSTPPTQPSTTLNLPSSLPSTQLTQPSELSSTSRCPQPHTQEVSTSRLSADAQIEPLVLPYETYAEAVKTKIDNNVFLERA